MIYVSSNGIIENQKDSPCPPYKKIVVVEVLSAILLDSTREGISAILHQTAPTKILISVLPSNGTNQSKRHAH